MSKPYARILIVDDNKDIHADFSKVLTRDIDEAGKAELEVVRSELFGEEKHVTALPLFEVVSAFQGQEALALVKHSLEENNPFSLTFVDIRMPPGWDGIETIENIWKIDPNIQSVICTAYSDFFWEEVAARLHPFERLLILKKPFDNIEIRQMAVALTEKWHLSRDLKTHIKNLEKIVREQVGYVKNIVEVLPSGVLAIDDNENVIECNQACINMWNFPAELIASKKYSEVSQYILSQLKNAKHFPLQPSEKNHELQLKDDRIFKCCLTPLPINNEKEGKVWMFQKI